MLEVQIAELHDAMAQPTYYQGGGDRIASDAAKLTELEESLASAYARWEELDG
jgi:ATP-binding cassette subfamily F protein uup